MTSSQSRVVIVGAGQGGLQVAISLRQEGFEGSITLIGDEPGLPYQRPPLSKAYLKTGDVEGLTLRPSAFFEKNRIELIAKTTVNRLDRAGRKVIASEQAYEFDHLILATGTSNFRPPINGLERALDLRTLEDAKRLREGLDRSRRIAVIGGGFIGLEFAAVARASGHDVTVVETAPRLLSRAVSHAMSARFLDFHRALGTRILLGASVAHISDTSVTVSNGEDVEADLVLLAAGVRPNVKLAEDARLSVENGIIVDQYLLTLDPNISALGDCASFPDPRTGRSVRLESVQAATDHARLIARRLVKGDLSGYTAVPWFWSDQANWKLQIAGLSGPEDESIPVGETAVFRFSEGILTAVETINDAKNHMKARKVLASREPCSRDMLERGGYDLSLS
ncbi:NAD(P)/FAD-dependent oxidoreductase [Martelella soudanensis]|uniref:NAD(P)/FAD-dependent oxidoreductase n=1 Tax=unclassified Martelella TaxID=2629616 RepID=UPI0015DDE830|nr:MULTISPECIES: FAD-dependent oxidoreductase [unclassified Martelella]